MDIFIIQYKYQSNYLVIIDGNVNVYKYEKCKFDQPILSFEPKHIFFGKSKVCAMTEMSGAGDEIDFGGNTLLLESEDNEYVYISGLETSKFKTDDKIIDYISLIGNNMIPYTFAVGEKYTYFLSSHYKFIENDNIEEGTFLKATKNCLDPYDYHVEKCGKDAFKKLEHIQIHTCWPGFGEHEENEDDYLVEEDAGKEDLIVTNYCYEKKEVVKKFSQKCVICLERDSIYAFRQCGHQCICEQCYQNKGDIDILKCVVCRT